MPGQAKRSELFIKDFIPRVSRTFALAIRFLPRGLRFSVYMSYLLCRVADTLEDSPHLETEERRRRLLRLSSILRKASGGDGISPVEVASLYESIDSDAGEDHRLLVESSRLFEILESLPDAHRPIIYRRAAEMAGGMAEFANLSYLDNDTIGALPNLKEWDRYCYYVAGTVGFMLTELFIVHYRFSADRAAEMTRHGNSFGLGLQKVNVLKDVPDDRQRGACYLPLDAMIRHGLKPSLLKDPYKYPGANGLVSELSANTLVHLDDAITYTTLIPQGYRGVRMFLLVSVFLAAATMKLILENPYQCLAGPPVKISRNDVARLIAAAAGRVSSNRSIREYYDILRPKVR